MSGITTSDPIALRYLITETIFDISEQPIPGANQQRAMPEPVVTQEPLFDFYGKNKRNYLFLTQEQHHKWMPPTALDAFTKTLTALRLTEEDIAILNMGAFTAPPSKDDILSFFNPKVLVSLGASLQWPELNSLPSESVANYNGITIFHTYTFDDMLVDAEKKRLFWTTIKNLLI